MNIINIPKDSTSDTKVKLIQIFKVNGEEISVGDLLCEIETSKAIAEIESQFEGYVYFLVKTANRSWLSNLYCIRLYNSRKPNSFEG